MRYSPDRASARGLLFRATNKKEQQCEERKKVNKQESGGRYEKSTVSSFVHNVIWMHELRVLCAL